MRRLPRSIPAAGRVLAALAAFLVPSARAQQPAAPVAPPPAAAESPAGDAVRETGADLAKLEADSKAQPNDPVRLARYGLGLVRSGKADEGLALVVRAVGMAPEEPGVLILQAKALAAAKRGPEAAEVALKVARSPLAPKWLAAEAYFMAGSLRWKQGALAEAEEDLRQAVTLDPRNGGATLNLGLLLYSSGKIPEGLMYMEKAADASPDNAQVQMRLARVMEAMGRIDRAIVYWTRAVEVLPDDGDIRFILGNHLYTVGRYEEAAAQLQRAVELRPSDQNARLSYAGTLLRLKRFDEARAQAVTARELGAGAAADSMIEVIEFEQRQAR